MTNDNRRDLTTPVTNADDLSPHRGYAPIKPFRGVVTDSLVNTLNLFFFLEESNLII